VVIEDKIDILSGSINLGRRRESDLVLRNLPAPGEPPWSPEKMGTQNMSVGGVHCLVGVEQQEVWIQDGRAAADGWPRLVAGSRVLFRRYVEEATRPWLAGRADDFIGKKIEELQPGQPAVDRQGHELFGELPDFLSLGQCRAQLAVLDQALHQVSAQGQRRWLDLFTAEMSDAPSGREETFKAHEMKVLMVFGAQ
jgi:hypothetical protein